MKPIHHYKSAYVSLQLAHQSGLSFSNIFSIVLLMMLGAAFGSSVVGLFGDVAMIWHWIGMIFGALIGGVAAHSVHSDHRSTDTMRYRWEVNAQPKFETILTAIVDAIRIYHPHLVAEPLEHPIHAALFVQPDEYRLTFGHAVKQFSKLNTDTSPDFYRKMLEAIDTIRSIERQFADLPNSWAWAVYVLRQGSKEESEVYISNLILEVTSL